MSNYKTVAPRETAANGLMPIFSSCKKWTIWCGECPGSWTEKVPAAEECVAKCPHCGTFNVWSLSRFMRNYQARIDSIDSLD